MKVSIIGAGYVGLVSGACLAEQDHIVTCIDSNEARIEQIRSCAAPFFEPDLNELLAVVVGETLFASSDFDAAVLDSELTLIAVGTPSREDGSVDLGAIEGVARQLGEVIRDKNDFHVVVVKSTVPAGTTENLIGTTIETVSAKARGKDFGLGMNPEFLTEGTAVSDFRNPDRIVIGGADERTLAVQRELYAGFAGSPILEVNNSTAEMIKYMSNALLATLISFANEFANLSSAVGGIDANEVQRGVQLSRYLTVEPDRANRTAPLASFIEAGCGFGGSCLPKDLKGLVSFGREHGQPMRLLEAVLATNAEQPARMLSLLRRNTESLEGLKVTILGLSFRPDTNDMRESPAIPIIGMLADAGCQITAYDPEAIEEARQVITTSGVNYADSLEKSVVDADAVLLVTCWDEFQRLSDVLRQHGRNPIVIDGRRSLDKSAFGRYDGIGL